MPKFPLLPRKKHTDKSDYGHVLVVAGSRAMPGAAVLAALASIRSGAGLVTLAAPKSLKTLLFKKLTPEIMYLSLPETDRGTLSTDSFPIIKKYVHDRKVNVIAAGPGLGHDSSVGRVVEKILTQLNVPVVLDADGLNCFKGKVRALKRHRGPLIMTPHGREFERLFGVKCPKVAAERSSLAKKLSALYDGVLVLKSHRTITAYRGVSVTNRTGNPGMAKGGTGDVLTGVIAAFLAQGLGAFEAAVWAVHFHGKAGDAAVRKKSELSLLASDLIDALPKIFSGK